MGKFEFSDMMNMDCLFRVEAIQKKLMAVAGAGQSIADFAFGFIALGNSKEGHSRYLKEGLLIKKPRLGKMSAAWNAPGRLRRFLGWTLSRRPSAALAVLCRL
jgi:hypothetical protein